MGRPRQAATTKATIAAQQIRCYELRLTGMSLDQITATTGLPRSTVYDRITAYINGKVLPLADEVRKLELDRLDRWLMKLDAEIESGKAVARNVEVAVKVGERRAKLTGADAAIAVEAVVTQVTQEDIALAELIREAQASAAIAEAQLRSDS